jgi:hypothetical protein
MAECINEQELCLNEGLEIEMPNLASLRLANLSDKFCFEDENEHIQISVS